MAGNGKIFISHARNDAALCAPLLEALRTWDADVWYEATCPPGATLSSRVREAITERDVFIRVCTPAAQRSTRVRQETAAFRALIADDIATRRARRTLINLILASGYQREPFDHATVFIDATRQTPDAWRADLRKALQTRGRTSLPLVAPQ